MRRSGVRLTLAAAAVCLPALAVPASAPADWTAPLDLSAPLADASDPQVALDDEGDAVFAWERFDGSVTRVQARPRTANGTLGAVQALSAPGQSAFEPQVAVDSTGDAVFTWALFDGTDFRVQARTRAANGALSAVQTLSAAGQSASNPQVAVDDAGNAVFTWRRSDGTNNRVQARVRAANGALSAVKTLSGAGQDALGPQVAVDPTGDTVFTWARDDGSNDRVQARALAANGTLSAVQNLSGAGQDAFNPQVAIDSTGDAVFTWRRSDGTNLRAQARGRAANGTLGPVQTLSGAGQDAVSPQVAVDPEGNAATTWQRSDGLFDRIQASFGP